MKNFSGIIYTDGCKILLMRRSESHLKGKWDIPGGHIESEENTLQAAERESEEEIGTVVGSKLHKFNDPSIYVFKVKIPFKVRLNWEHDRIKWVDLGEVGGMDLHPAFKIKWKEYYKKIKELMECRSFKEYLEMERHGYCRIRLYEQ